MSTQSNKNNYPCQQIIIQITRTTDYDFNNQLDKKNTTQIMN